ncbi:MAG: hypothetical protein ACM3XN_03715 [Chloroflexota bacterium]
MTPRRQAAPSARRAARIGMLTGLTIALQIAPTVLPGLGLALSAFSTLPIFVLTRGAPGDGLIGIAAAAAVLVALRPGGALLLVLLTAPVGLALGWTGHCGWRPAARLLTATAAETAGLAALGAIIGAPVFSRIVPLGSRWLIAALVAGFALVYSFLWGVVLEGFVMPLLRRLPFWRELSR